MDILKIIKITFLGLFCMLINLPYGIDAPDKATTLSCTLDNGAVLCEQTADGYTASFSTTYRQEYRHFLANGDYYELKVFVMQPDDVITPQDDPGAFLTHWQYLEDEAGHPGMNVTYIYEIEGGKLLIRDGSEFTLDVTVILPPDTPAGTYSLTTSFDDNWENVYRDVLIVR